MSTRMAIAVNMLGVAAALAVTWWNSGFTWLFWVVGAIGLAWSVGGPMVVVRGRRQLEGQ